MPYSYLSHLRCSKTGEMGHQLVAEAAAAAKTQDTRIATLETELAEKKAALAEVKNQVAMLTLEVTEKLLRKTLSNEKEQKALVDEFIKDIKLN